MAGPFDHPGLDQALNDDPAYRAAQQQAAQKTLETGVEQPGLIPGESPPIPTLTPGQANQAAPPVPPPFPMMTPGMADGGVKTTTQSVTQTTGPDAASKTNIEEAGGQAVEARERAADQTEQAGVDQAARQTEQGTQDAMRQAIMFFGVQQQMADQQAQYGETERRLKEAAAFRPDPKRLFKDDNAFDVIVTIVGALASGWVQGVRGGPNTFLNVLDKMIDQDVEAQVRANDEQLKELRRKLGSHEAAVLELKARMKEASAEFFAARDLINDAPNVRVQAQLQAEKMRADASELRMKVAQEVASKVSRTTTRTSVKTPAGALPININDPKQEKTLGAVGGVLRMRDLAHGLNGSGALANSVGLFDENWDRVKGVLHARSGDEKKVETLKGQFEALRRRDWQTEPNGQEVQLRLSQLAWPENEAQIPAFLQEIDSILMSLDPAGRYTQTYQMLHRSGNYQVGRGGTVVK